MPLDEQVHTVVVNRFERQNPHLEDIPGFGSIHVNRAHKDVGPRSLVAVGHSGFESAHFGRNQIRDSKGFHLS